MKLNQIFYPPITALLVLAAALGALATAYISQYFFNYPPCELCLWQRGPLWVAIMLAVLLLAHGRQSGLVPLYLALLTLSFLTAAGIAFFHVGVEQHWWLGTGACTGGSSDAGQDLVAKLLATPVARCDEISWRFMGLSMATWNVPFSLGLAALCARSLLAETRRRI